MDENGSELPAPAARQVAGCPTGGARIPGSDRSLKQSVPVAEGVQIAYAVHFEPRLSASLRIQLDKLDPLVRRGRKEGKIVIAVVRSA